MEKNIGDKVKSARKRALSGRIAYGRKSSSRQASALAAATLRQAGERELRHPKEIDDILFAAPGGGPMEKI
jgi:hypothetical protein